MKRRKNRGREPGSSRRSPLRALSVECSGSDRAVRVRWLLSLIRPAHSRSSNQAGCAATSKVELQSGACSTPQQVLKSCLRPEGGGRRCGIQPQVVAV